MIASPIGAVLALNSLQKSISGTPCCPRAGPTGGAGVAFPAGRFNLTYALTFLTFFVGAIV
jgi:hypothetical protein